MFKLIESERLRKLLKNFAALVISSKSQGLLIFIQSIIVAHWLGVANYGRWAIVVTFCALVMSFLGIKTGDVLGKFVVELKAKKEFALLRMILKRTILIDFSLRLLALASIYLFSFAAARWFKGPAASSIYLIYGTYHFLQFIEGTWFSLERDNDNYKTIAFVLFLEPFIRLAFICLFFLVLKEAGLTNLAVSFALGSAAVFIIKLLRLEKLLKNYDHGSLKEVLKSTNDAAAGCGEADRVLKDYRHFMRANYFSTSFLTLLRNMDILAAGYFFSEQSVGLVRLAKNLAKVIQEFAGIMGKPLYQEFNELLAAKKKQRIFSILKKNLKYYLAGLFILLFIISLFVEPFIKFVYGSEFLDASIFFRIYLFIVFVTLGSFWAHPLMLALGGWNFKLKMLFLSLLVLPVTILLFKSLWGVVGIVVGVISIRFLLNLSFVMFGWKELKKDA